MARNYCFTSFNIPNIDTEHVQYYIYQKERCPSTQKVHYQGYIELSHTMRLNKLKVHVFRNSSTHIEPRKGSQSQAIEYCRKAATSLGEEPIVYGEPAKQGRRSDLNNYKEYLETHHDIYDVLDNYPNECIKYFKQTKEIINLYKKKETNHFRTVHCQAVVGPAGSGKTRLVYDKFGYDNVFKLDQSDGDRLWFDGYNGEAVLLIDDFYGWIKYGMFLNILNGYPLRLPVKGSFCYANWTKVWITSNDNIETWYSRGYTAALNRRLHSTTVTGY